MSEHKAEKAHTEYVQLRQSIERLAAEWESIAKQAASGGYMATLSPITCAAALRNRLAEVRHSPGREAGR